jgi:hypothetical protein
LSRNLSKTFHIPRTIQRDIVYQYSENQRDVLLFNLLRIKGLYLFRALLAHPQEALIKRHLVGVYCVRVMSFGCYQGWSEDEQVMLETCRGP